MAKRVHLYSIPLQILSTRRKKWSTASWPTALKKPSRILLKLTWSWRCGAIFDYIRTINIILLNWTPLIPRYNWFFVLQTDYVDVAYRPIIQSGGEYDFKMSAVCNDRVMHYGVILCQAGARWVGGWSWLMLELLARGGCRLLSFFNNLQRITAMWCLRQLLFFP